MPAAYLVILVTQIPLIELQAPCCARPRVFRKVLTRCGVACLAWHPQRGFSIENSTGPWSLWPHLSCLMFTNIYSLFLQALINGCTWVRLIESFDSCACTWIYQHFNRLSWTNLFHIFKASSSVCILKNCMNSDNAKVKCFFGSFGPVKNRAGPQRLISINSSGYLRRWDSETLSH